MKENLQRMFYKSGRRLKRNAPIILTGFSVIGVVATTITAIKATPKALSLIEQAEERKDDALTILETLQIATPIYIPTVLLGVSTIACIISANTINQKQQASLSSSYMLLNETFKKYRHNAKKIYGDDADDRIIAEIAKDMYLSADGCKNYYPNLDNSDKVLFYESHSGEYFTSTMAAVINAQYHINRNLILKGWISVNDYRNFLGLPDVFGYDNVGWQIDRFYDDNIMWLDFNNHFTELEDGLECYIIYALYAPMLEMDYDIY